MCRCNVLYSWLSRAAWTGPMLCRAWQAACIWLKGHLGQTTLLWPTFFFIALACLGNSISTTRSEGKPYTVCPNTLGLRCWLLSNSSNLPPTIFTALLLLVCIYGVRFRVYTQPQLHFARLLQPYKSILKILKSGPYHIFWHFFQPAHA